MFCVDAATEQSVNQRGHRLNADAKRQAAGDCLRLGKEASGELEAGEELAGTGLATNVLTN